MKLYKVFLADKREINIRADSYSEVDERIVFFRNGEGIPDVFVVASTVAAINVIDDNFDPNTEPRVIPQVDPWPEF